MMRKFLAPALASLMMMAAAEANAAAAAAPAQPQGLVARRDLSFALAKTIADVALRTCEAGGHTVSVHVVDRYGNTVVAYMGQGAAVHTFENSRRKAYTAMTFRRPSREFGDRLAMGDTGAQLQLMLPNMSGQQGGLPIRVGNDVIGGAGMSGSQGGMDEPCIQAGIDAVAAQLR
jgi:uncharacterized protein GlcG (DUF336 family)